jgi:GMP synthase (glutamine-hydrolysing)
MKRVLALVNIGDDPPGHLGEIMQERGIACDAIKVEDTLLPDPTDYAAIIALGGPQHAAADDKHPYLAQEKVLIRKAVEQDIPYLGICLGGQLLAHALGARVTKHHMIELGFLEVELTEEGRADPLFQGLPDSQKVFQWHMDVFDIPAGGVRLATNANAPNQAFRYGERAYGLQYHIELTPDMFYDWLQYLPNDREVIDELGLDVPNRLEREISLYYSTFRSHTRIMFENFLKISGL